MHHHRTRNRRCIVKHDRLESNIHKCVDVLTSNNTSYEREMMKDNGSQNIRMVLLSVIIVLAVVAVVTVFEPDERTDDDDTGVLSYYDKKCKSFSEENADLAKGQIVFIGDSITDLYVLDDHYSDLSLECYNRGISGDTTFGVMDRLKVSLYDIDPSIVVLMIGTNDINGGHNVDLIMQRYAWIMDDIYANLPGVELYCMSIIPQNSQLEEYTSIRIDHTTPVIMSANEMIRQLANEKGATYLDLFTLVADGDNHLIRGYSDDGIHLNYAGLAVWTDLIKPYLDR